MRLGRRVWWVVAFGIVVAAGCAGTVSTVKRDQNRVSIVTFNVENLFDTRDDPGKNDATYLPLSAKSSAEHRAGCAEIAVAAWRQQCLELDWSEPVLERKLKAVAASVLASTADRRGPDILVLQEVENRAVVERLRRDYLAAAGYRPTVLLEGNDRRGIDVAFLSRLPLVGDPVLHEVPYADVSAAVRDDTRGILEATFRLPDGTALTGFAVHFPAPFHPVELRVESYAALDALLAKLPDDRLAFAAGDFNTTSGEAWVIDQHVEPRWQVAHRQGCAGCPGTYYYARDDNWSFLDMILINRVNTASWRLDPSRTTVARFAAGQVQVGGTPRRFDPVSGGGVSDHWPLHIELVRGAL